MKLTNTQPQVALITGGARRIGAAITKALHHAGYNVAIHCHQSIQEANLIATQLNQLRSSSARVFQADLSLPHLTNQLIDDVLTWQSNLAILINNASLFVKDCNIKSNEDWQTLMAVNVQSPYWLSVAGFKALVEQQGNIINITDIHADKPLKHYGIYCQTKAALSMQTKALAREFGPDIRVNAVAPGAILWPEAANALDTVIQENIIHNTPLKKHGEPVFIAEAVLSLIKNAFITGQTLRVDGGRTLI